MFAVACLVVTPPLHYYFKYLDRFLPGNSLSTTIKKLAIDQLIAAPLNIGILMGATNFLQNQSIHSVKSKLDSDFLPTLKANYMIWPAVNFINFKVIPPPQRILYVSFIGFFWNIFLSFKTNKTVAPDKKISSISGPII